MDMMQTLQVIPSLTLILHLYAKNLYRYIRKRKPMITLTVYLRKVKMSLLLHQRGSYIF
uniref:Uncharacterized protein n=2 Tax=Macaca TaxID=9539 RepID=A0A2K6AMC1_MACNE|nr:unnamed protein product [Macaca fascicularis]